MKITVKEQDSYAVLEIEGSLSVDNRNYFEKYLNQFCESGKNVVIDLSRVTYIDSASLGAILLYHALYQKNSLFFIAANVNDSIYQMFILTGMPKKIKMMNTVAEAADFIGKGGE